jgi:choline monooxygenase
MISRAGKGGFINFNINHYHSFNSKLNKKYFSVNVRNEILKFNPTTPIEEAITPPSSWYLKPEIYELECEKVFKNNWLGIASDNGLNNEGDYFTGEMIDQPFIILKNKTCEIKAFYNVCSHHASQVANGCGSSAELVCPYHGWTYNLDGNLIKSTSMKGIKNFRVKENGLKSIALRNLGNILFLNLNKQTDKTDESWDDFREISLPFINALEKFNFDPTFSDLKFVARKQYKINCNWKVFVDNYCDGGYHVPYAHKNLNSSLDLNTYKSEIYNKCSIQSTFSSSNNYDGRIGNRAIYTYIYPNIMFNRYGSWLDINVVIPHSEKECTILIEWFLCKNFIHDTDFIEKSLKASEEIQKEDVFLCENVMKGIKSDAYDCGRYVPSKESPAYHFHQELFKNLI